MPDLEAARRDRLVALLADGSAGDAADAVLVTDQVGVRYLSGFTGSAGALLLLASGRVVLATDGRYVTQAGEEAPDVEVVVSRQPGVELLRSAEGTAARRVAFQADHVTVAAFRALSAAFSGELVELGDRLTGLRMVKDATELDHLRRACAISDAALAELLPTLGQGQTERQIGRRLESLMLDHGAEAVGFDTIVASGPHSAIPHHRPTDRSLARGDFLTVDFGARVAGYHADMTRTFVIGGPPSTWQQEVYLAVAAAQRSGRAALAVGAAAADVDGAARNVLEEAGLAQHFSHGLGHGVGLEIHEAPYLGQRSADRLDAGVPVTVEPGVYLPGRGGVRIEDTLVVQRRGPDCLTTTTRELLVLD